jgi:rare lipoprotein A
MSGLHMSVQAQKTYLSTLVGAVLLLGLATVAVGGPPGSDRPVVAGDVPSAASPAAPSETAPTPKPPLDRSGRKRVGKASFYADRFGGRKMADGKVFHLHDSNAASRTLPLGTTAKVTNLETGRSAVVTIQDRGPYVDGRIVDLSPATARSIGLSQRKGVTKVEVTPITVPLPNGGVKLGQAADDPILALNERRDRGEVSQEQWDTWN